MYVDQHCQMVNVVAAGSAPKCQESAGGRVEKGEQEEGRQDMIEGAYIGGGGGRERERERD